MRGAKMKMSPTEMGGHDNNMVYQTKKKHY